MKSYRFADFAAANPDAEAIVDPSGRGWSRREIAWRSNQFSRALRHRGLKPGDVLALASPNCAEFMIAYLAASQIGLYVLPVCWHLASAEIRYILDDSCARAFVTHQRLRDSIPGVMSGLRKVPDLCISLDGEIPGFAVLSDFASGTDGSILGDPVHGRVLAYTSATSGRPKGVLLPLAESEQALDLAIGNRVSAGTLPERHVHLCASMLYHGAPLEAVAVGLHLGHKIVLMSQLAPELLLQQVEAHSVTYAYIFPAMFARLLQLPADVRQRYKTDSLQRVIHAGATCPPEIKKRMIDWWGPIFWEAYGATEGSGTVVNSSDWLRFPGTVGRPIPGTKLMILDEEGQPLPPGVPGDIYYTRYAGDRFEYLGDPEKTKAAHKGDFFTVGDVGYVNEEGFLFLCDRKIDMINLSGMKVYSAEIEGMLMLHPGVADCAVLGVPDPVFGEAILAVIEPRELPESAGAFRSLIMGYLREHLSFMKLPRHIEVVAALGRSVTGKLQKRHFRDRFLANQAGNRQDC